MNMEELNIHWTIRFVAELCGHLLVYVRANGCHGNLKNQYLIIDKIESTRITSNWIRGQQSIDLIELENGLRSVDLERKNRFNNFRVESLKKIALLSKLYL